MLLLGVSAVWITFILQKNDKTNEEIKHSQEIKAQQDRFDKLDSTNISLVSELTLRNEDLKIIRLQNDSLKLQLFKLNDQLILAQKNLIELSNKTIGELTGEGSFCYFTPHISPKYQDNNFSNIEFYTLSLGLVIEGVNPLRNIKYCICDELEQTPFYNGNYCIDNRMDLLIGNTYLPSNVITQSEKININKTLNDLIFLYH